jgi:hypothetical protein
MVYTIRLLLIGSCILFFQRLSAQSLFEQVEVQSTTIERDTVGTGENARLSVSTAKELTAMLTDTANIASIVIKLGDTQGASNLLNQTYAFSGTQLSSTLFLERSLNRLRLGIGVVTDKDAYYITLEAKNSSGQLIGTYSTIAY